MIEPSAPAPGCTSSSPPSAASPISPVGSLLHDTQHHRLLAGEGCFDLEGVLGNLAAKPGIGGMGVEVLSDDLWTLAPAEIGRRAAQALEALLERVGWPETA